jgi:hypothetical protein
MTIRFRCQWNNFQTPPDCVTIPVRLEDDKNITKNRNCAGSLADRSLPKPIGAHWNASVAKNTSLSSVAVPSSPLSKECQQKQIPTEKNRFKT